MGSSLQTLLEVPSGYRSETVARFMWQLDEQRRALLDGTRGLSAAELEWQLAPGTNSIGMLLAHIAYAESHLVQVGLEGKTTSDTKSAIGIGEDEEGLPLGPDDPPSPALAGRDLAWFDAALERARAHTRSVARSLSDADLAREVRRSRPDGTRRVFNVGWVLYHLLEHEAGHRAQIALLRHLMKLRGVGPGPGA